MRRALGPTQVTWLLSAGLAAGALVLTTRTGAGPIIALHLPVAAVVVVLGAGFFFAERFLLNVEFRRQAHTFTLAGIPSVSYTHLRAHETGRNLVCRLLLEKKKQK